MCNTYVSPLPTVSVNAIAGTLFTLEIIELVYSVKKNICMINSPSRSMDGPPATMISITDVGLYKAVFVK